MLNKMTIIGKVHGDVKIYTHKSGEKEANFNVMTETVIEGKKTRVAFQVTAKLNLIEMCESLLSDGRLVYVEGPCNTNGLIAQHVGFLSSGQTANIEIKRSPGFANEGIPI